MKPGDLELLKDRYWRRAWGEPSLVDREGRSFLGRRQSGEVETGEIKRFLPGNLKSQELRDH